MNKFNTNRLVQVALLIALEIILSRFLSISTPIVKIGFAFLPLSLIAILYGPFYAGLAGAIADFLGAVLFPIGAYFPGFTLTAFLTGAVYGLLLHKRTQTLIRVACCVLVITLFLHLGLNTLWLYIISGKAITAILPARLIQSGIMFPIQVAGVYLAGRRLITEKFIREAI